jgi:hypothetical protein
MPSPAYNLLLNTVSSYVDSKKAAEVLSRQLSACSLTADSIAASDIKANCTRFSTAFSLYVSDSNKRDELKAKLATF